MNKLIKLELKKNKLNTCIISLIVISILMTGFMYMIATITKVEKDKNFTNYYDLLRLHTGVVFLIFSIVSIIIYSKFILEDYSPERRLLLFSYPVSRTKIFVSKLILINEFIIGGLLLSTIIPNGLFFLTESFFPILNFNMSLNIVYSQFINIINTILAICSIGFISLRISIVSKSIHTTIVTTIILCVIFGNVLIGLPISIFKTIGFMIFFVIGIAFAISANNQIKKMEV